MAFGVVQSILAPARSSALPFPIRNRDLDASLNNFQISRFAAARLIADDHVQAHRVLS